VDIKSTQKKILPKDLKFIISNYDEVISALKTSAIGLCPDV